jgi:hypothetical protein
MDEVQKRINPKILIFYTEDGGRTFIRNVRKYLRGYTMSDPRGQQSSCCNLLVRCKLVHVRRQTTYYARKDSVSYKSVVSTVGCITLWGEGLHAGRWRLLSLSALLFTIEVSLDQKLVSLHQAHPSH